MCSPGAVWWSLVSQNPAQGCCRELGSTPQVRAWAQENVQSLNVKEKQFCRHCCLLNIYKKYFFFLVFSYMRFQPLSLMAQSFCAHCVPPCRMQVMAAILEPSRGLPCAVKHLFPVSYPIFPCLRSAAGILLLKATPTVDKADQKLL